MSSQTGQPLARLDITDVHAVDSRKRALRRAAFEYQGDRLTYQVEGGNKPYDNERAIELAIAERVLEAHGDPSTVIEVGNVLGHYFPTNHAVIDKFEHHRKVTWNEDVVPRPPFAPNLIVSIAIRYS